MADETGADGGSNGAALPATTLAAIDAAVAETMADGLVPGLSLAVTDRERTLVSRTYGLADRERGRPVEPTTLFEIGSIGKTFAAVVVLQLVEAGRIELDAPATRYLPWFAVAPPAGGGPITIEHLLTHTAGLTAGTDGTPEGAFQVWALRDLVPGSAPGTRYHYSNVGYKVLGLVIEAVEDAPYPDVLRRRVLEPLGMTRSEPEITNASRDRLAIGYESAFDDRITWAGRPLARATWLETATADGAIASTAEDMATFLRLLATGGRGPNGRLLDEGSIEAMRTAGLEAEPGLRYGLGLATRRVGPRTFIGHGGGMVGYLAGVQLDPDAGIGCVVLQNGPGGAPVTLARRVVALVAPIAESAPAVAGTTSETAATTAETAATTAEPPDPAILGRYRCENGHRPPIELRTGPADALELRTEDRAIPLEPWDDEHWLVQDRDWDDALLWAERGPDETADRVTLWHGAERFVPVGAPERQRSTLPTEHRAHVGAYRAHNPWCPMFRIVARDDRLWLLFPVAPDGFEDEQPLTQLPDGSFQAGEDPGGPERLRFDTPVAGRSLRAWLSGWPYYLTG